MILLKKLWSKLFSSQAIFKGSGYCYGIDNNYMPTKQLVNIPNTNKHNMANDKNRLALI